MTGRLIVGSDGRRRLWYEVSEVEAMMQAALEDARLMPTAAPYAVDVESLIEHHLAAEVDYSGTTAEGVLGYTVFEDPVRVVVNRELTDLATCEGARPGHVGRWRATIAHEAAHILLHRRLFGDQPEGRPPMSFARCSGAVIEEEAPATKDWREVQANMGMAALLMPAVAFDTYAAEAFLKRLPLPIPPLQSAHPVALRLVGAISVDFKVSRRAALIRCQSRGFIAPS